MTQVRGERHGARAGAGCAGVGPRWCMLSPCPFAASRPLQPRRAQERGRPKSGPLVEHSRWGRRSCRLPPETGRRSWCGRLQPAPGFSPASLWFLALALLLSLPALPQTVGPNLNLTKAAGNQYEPAVAINPANNNQIFLASRNEVGGLYTARSNDGGATWTSQLIARTGTPAAGDLPRAYGNASVAWDVFGNLFLAYLVQSSPSASTYIGLALSQDGGATFYSPAASGSVLLLPDNSQPMLGDRPTVRVGPGSAGFPGSVWVTYWTKGGVAVSGAGVSGLDKVGLFTSWRPQQPTAVNFGDVAVGPNGEVIVTYGPNSASSRAIYINVKPDGLGAGSFSTFNTVVPVNMGGFTNIPAQPNWGIDPEPRLAWDRSGGPHQGRVYLSYTDAPSLGSADTNIFVVHSDDTGATWSAPVRVNDDAGANSQFLPALSLDQRDGTIAVTWYDARNSATNDTALYYGAFSTDGATTFSPNFPIAAGTSNQANSKAAANYKKAGYGDYTGNALVNGRLVPAWADNSNSTGDNPDGATNFDVYTAIVQVEAASGTITLAAMGNSASYAASSLAPGEVVTLFGIGLGPAVLTMAALDANDWLPMNLAGVRVLFNGSPAPLVYVSDKTIAAITPFSSAATSNVQVQVENNGNISNELALPLKNTMPGLYSADSSGSGQGAITYPDGSMNSAQNPAAAEAAVTLWASGLGLLFPQPADGSVVTGPALPVLQFPIAVTIGGQPAQIVYQGPAPMAPAGLYQINCKVPSGLPPGPAAVVLTSDGVESQPNLTIALR